MRSSLNCPCGQPLTVSDAKAGSKVKCPSCGRVLKLRTRAGQAPGDDGPALPTPRRPAGARRWAFRLGWLAPAAACAALFLLVLASLPPVRRAVVGVVRPGPKAVAAKAVEREKPARSTFRPKPDEKVLEVLPPPAAQQPGRTLPKMLLVGDGPDMFPALEDAVALAMPGDVIEIRTSRTLPVQGAELRVPDAPAGSSPLVIRAGAGYSPVLCRPARVRAPMVRLVGVDLVVRSIDFTGLGARIEGPPSSLFQVRNAGLRFEDCSFTGVTSPNSFGIANVQNFTASYRPLLVVFDHTLTRGCQQALHIAGPAIAIEARDSAFVSSNPLIAVQPYSGQSLFISRSLMYNVYNLAIEGFLDVQYPVIGRPRFDGSFKFHMDRSLHAQASCCAALVTMNISRDLKESLGEDWGSRALRLVFRQFEVVQSGVHRADRAGWGSVVCVNFQDRTVYADTWLNDSIFPSIPPRLGAVMFGPTMLEAKRLLAEGTPAEQYRAFCSVLPSDMDARPAEQPGEPSLRDVDYGFDPRGVPTPPPVTLDPDLSLSPTVVDFGALEVGQSEGVRGWKVDYLPDTTALPGEWHYVCPLAKAGDWIEFKAKAPEPGRYAVHATLTGDAQHGRVRLALNGRTVAEDVDLYSPGLTPLRPLNLGLLDTKDGEFVLRVESLGKNAKSSGYNAGITQIHLRPLAAR